MAVWNGVCDGDWLAEIKADELPYPYDEIARNFGIDVAVGFAKLYQGSGFYCPKLDYTIAKFRRAKIIEEFKNGFCDYKKLAHKYGITEQWVRQIVAEGTELNQTSMF